MSEKYFYLNKFKVDGKATVRNWFKPVNEADIKICEQSLSFFFPNQLKDFYKKIGYGCIRGPEDPSRLSDPDNLILDPQMISDILLKQANSMALPNIEFNEGDMPFFEVGDGTNFLVMRPQSENPNAVYDMWGDLIEKDFETFIHKLYYEAPDYYMKNW